MTSIDGSHDSNFEGIPLAYAKCRIRYGESDKPEEIEFITINRAFETMLDRDCNSVKGRGIKEIFPKIVSDAYPWFDQGVKVAQGGGPVSFFQPILSLGGWFSGMMYSHERDCLEVLFNPVEDFSFPGLAGRIEGFGNQPTGGFSLDYPMDPEPLERILPGVLEIDRLVSHMRDGIIFTDQGGRIFLCNPPALRMTGWKDTRVIGRNIREVFMIIHPESQENLTGELFETLFLQDHFVMRGLELLQRDSGQILPIEGNMIRYRGLKSKGFSAMITFRDDSDNRHRQRRFLELSYHDHLTGIHNRRYLEEGIRRLDTKRNLPLAIMSVDINGLKSINDSYGHQAGDEIIRRVGEILENVCRTEDVVARVGGDEFEILLPRTSEIQASRIKRRIQKAARVSQGPYGPLDFSIGYGVKTAMDEDIEEIRARADQDMYREKHQKRE